MQRVDARGRAIFGRGVFRSEVQSDSLGRRQTIPCLPRVKHFIFVRLGAYFNVYTIAYMESPFRCHGTIHGIRTTGARISAVVLLRSVPILTYARRANNGNGSRGIRFAFVVGTLR